jgi:hypothetical protein
MSGDLPNQPAMTVRMAETNADREACYALRYRVFIEEQRRHVPTVDHDRKLYRLEEDSSAMQLLANCGDEVVGTMRIHHGAASEIPLEIRERYEMHRFLAETPIEQMMSIAGLAMERHRRDGATTVTFAQLCFRLVKGRYPDTGLVFILAPEAPRLMALYEWFGFRMIDPNKRARLDARVLVPMFVRINASAPPW